MGKWSHLQTDINKALVPGTIHFRLYEIACKCSDRHPDEEWTCNHSLPAIVPEFWECAEKARVYLNDAYKREAGDLYEEQPIIFTSVYRCQLWNKHQDVKGHSTSGHLYGIAADIVIPRWIKELDNPEIKCENHVMVQILLRAGFLRVGLSRKDGFCHTDLIPPTRTIPKVWPY